MRGRGRPLARYWIPDAGEAGEGRWWAGRGWSGGRWPAVRYGRGEIRHGERKASAMQWNEGRELIWKQMRIERATG